MDPKKLADMLKATLDPAQRLPAEEQLNQVEIKIFNKQEKEEIVNIRENHVLVINDEIIIFFLIRKE